MNTQVHAHTEARERHRVSSCRLLSYSLKIRSLIELEAHYFGWPGQQALGTYPSPFPKTGVRGTESHDQLFMWVLHSKCSHLWNRLLRLV